VSFDDQKLPRLSSSEFMLSSEFIVGRELKITVCLLKDESLSANRRVIIVFTHGMNEIRMCAHAFFKYGAVSINTCMFHAREDVLDEEEELCEVYKVHGELTSDLMGNWVILRTYIDHYVADRINICAQTWVEILRLESVLKKVAEFYAQFVIQGRAVSKKEEQEDEEQDKNGPPLEGKKLFESI
jgi:mRNA-degrading endonuclease HigB of HigAB toxin-antitoxin module